MSQDMACGGRKKCLILWLHKRFILDFVKSSSHRRKRWDLLIHVCTMIKIHSAGQNEWLKSWNSPPEAEHSDRVQLPVLGNHPEQISSSVFKLIILNMFWSKCHELLTTFWPPASSSAHWGWVQAGRSQTNPQPWLTGSSPAALQALIPAPLTGWDGRTNAHLHSTQWCIRANALNSVDFYSKPRYKIICSQDGK